MIKILVSAKDDVQDSYQSHLEAELKKTGLEFCIPSQYCPSEIDYIVYAPNDRLKDFSQFTNVKAVLSLWAGVEKIISNPTLTQPICRMVDDSISLGMRDWVVGYVMKYHLDMDRDYTRIHGDWTQSAAPLARERRIAMIGFGELGRFCGEALSDLGFDVVGWSRRYKAHDTIPCFHGESGLKEALSQADIAVLLLPNTPQTYNIINAKTLAYFPKGARIINPGRGSLIDDEALLEALEQGQIAHATLDVFKQEPLPKEHVYWAHPNVTVTPHIAATTRPASAVKVIVDNILRSEAGGKLLYEVDRSAGY